MKLFLERDSSSRLAKSPISLGRSPETPVPVITSRRRDVKLPILAVRDPIRDGFSIKTSSSREGRREREEREKKCLVKHL